MSDTYISKEQFYKMAHVGKNTALKLIQEGLIPAIDTGKPTCRYLIAMKDVTFYLKDREENPEKYGLVHGKSTQSYPGKYDRRNAHTLSRYARRLLKEMPDLLTAQDVSEFLGYNTKTILLWSRQGKLARLVTTGQVYIPKKSLFRFMESKYLHDLQMKSEKHRELIRRASYEGL